MANDVQLVKNLYTELESALFLGDGLSKGEFGCLMNPGQFLNPEPDESLNGSNDMLLQSQMFNLGMDTQFLFTPKASTVDGMYKEIINNAAVPAKVLDADQEQELKDIRTWRINHRQTYDFYKTRYEAAFYNYESHRNSQNPDSTFLATLLSRKNQAKRDWQIEGYKREWDSRGARFLQLTSGDPAVYFQDDLIPRFDNQLRTAPAGQYYNTHFSIHPFHSGTTRILLGWGTKKP